MIASRTPTRRQLPILFTPVAAAIIFSLLFLIFHSVLQIDKKSGVDTKSNSQLQNAGTESLERTAAKVLFGASALGVTMALIWSIAVAVLILWRELCSWESVPKVICLTLLLVLILVVCVWMKLFNIGGTFVTSNLAAIGGNIDLLIRRMNMLAASTVIVIVGSLAAIANPQMNTDIKVLGERLRFFSLSIYSTAAVLGFAVLEVYALYHWGSVALTPVDMKVQGDNGSPVSTFTLGAGIVYSILMIVIYLPVAIFHHIWLTWHQMRAAESTKEFKADLWLTRNGLAGSPLKVFSTYLAMLAPLAVGVLTKIIGLGK